MALYIIIYTYFTPARYVPSRSCGEISQINRSFSPHMLIRGSLRIDIGPLFRSVHSNNHSMTLLKSHQIILEFNRHTAVRIKQLLCLSKVASVLGHSDSSSCVRYVQTRLHPPLILTSDAQIIGSHGNSSGELSRVLQPVLV